MDSSPADDSQPYPKPQPAIVVDGVVMVCFDIMGTPLRTPENRQITPAWDAGGRLRRIRHPVPTGRNSRSNSGVGRGAHQASGGRDHRWRRDRRAGRARPSLQPRPVVLVNTASAGWTDAIPQYDDVISFVAAIENGSFTFAFDPR